MILITISTTSFSTFFLDIFHFCACFISIQKQKKIIIMPQIFLSIPLNFFSPSLSIVISICMWGDCNLNDKRLVRIMTMESWKFFFQFSLFFLLASKLIVIQPSRWEKKSPKYYSKHDLKMAHTNRNYFTYFLKEAFFVLD